MTSVTVTYPLDIVRTRLSIQSASFADLKSPTQGQKLPGLWSTMSLMYRSEGGWLALYRGIIPTIAGVAPYVSRCCLEEHEYGSYRANLVTGRVEFHGLRIRTRSADTSWREEPKCTGQTRCWSHVWCCSSNSDLPFVSCSNPRHAMLIPNGVPVMSYAGDSKLIPCLAWVTSIRACGMP